jgi:RNA polymerase sigma factor (sigma-70 family)
MDTALAVSDAVLVESCLQGDQQSWIQLLERYKRLIYAVTVRFGFDNEDRHDIFQSVCLEVLKNLPSLRNASSVRYWILTITVRQCSALRKRYQQAQTDTVDEAAMGISDPRPNTLEIYVEVARAETLHQALNDLPERCRNLLRLLFFAEEKPHYTQLGDILGWSKDTIGSARLRCLDRLRRILLERGF